MIYLCKSDLTRAKEMNQKCREAGVIALDCEGNDSDMYGWPDTFYLYFPTEESAGVVWEGKIFMKKE